MTLAQKCLIFLISASALLSMASAMPIDEFFRRASTCSTSTVSCSGSTDACCVPTNGEMVLALQWLPGYCKTVTCASGVLSNLPANTWTIHGLWPDTCSGSQLSSCDSNRAYTNTQSQIQGSSIYNDMLTYWPSNSGNYNSFWNHEWSTHGTCYSPASASCTGGNGSNGLDLVKFFGDVLTARQTFNVYAALANAGITPGNSYSSTTIKTALQNAFGAAIGLQCASGYLQQVYISVIGIGGGAVAKGLNSNTPSSTCSGTIKYVA